MWKLSLYRVDQVLLGDVLPFQGGEDLFVNGILRYDVVNGYDLSLALAPEAGIGLLIQFKTPDQGKPDQDMAALLDVQAVA